MTAYRLTNIDTNAHTYHATLAGAKAMGDRVLETKGLWTDYARNFSEESQTGSQRNDGKTYLAIIPITINP